MQDDFPAGPAAFFPARQWRGREPYRRPNQVIAPPGLPDRDRAAHAEGALARAVGETVEAARQQLDDAETRGAAVGAPGSVSRFNCPGSQRAGIDYLADRRQHMEVVAVLASRSNRVTHSAPPCSCLNALKNLSRKIEAYRTRETPSGRPRNEPLVSRIDTVRLATGLVIVH